MQVAEKEKVYRALSDPTRREILDHLSKRAHSASSIPLQKSMSQPALSQHLRILRLAGLVVSKKQGRNRLYVLDATPLIEIYDWVKHYENFWSAKLSKLGKILDEEKNKDK
ncbi:MAG: winged helix-turn-helix transcriptional regulator [candidate division Zixibacteria bacterium]|nr:winged helix-turn-helix transcriptional regulator [candidate division Zixibacteria bacterium]